MVKAILLSIIFLLPAAVMAQDTDSRGEVFINVGRGVIFDDEGFLGSGTSIGGGIGFRLISKLGIEGEVKRIPHFREFPSGVQLRGTAVFININAIYHFSDSRIQPYVTGGAGFLHYRNKSRSPFPDEPFRGEPTSNSFAFNMGAGLKGFLTDRVSVRPEFKLLNSNDVTVVSDKLNIFHFSVALALHW
ncbi:MAG: outer membrane beta-barrel protein [Blastocatellia bacterium]|nr:outer membrane beta-barrel protein [Blastocatellia bacterium]